MREYNKDEYREKMIQVYGKKVVEYFEKFENKKDKSFPENYEAFKGKMESYVSRIGEPGASIEDDKLKKKASNFNTHKQFARFILISIEKHNQNLSINLSEKADESNTNKWQTEHILPQADKNNVDICYLRSLGNLTLISKELNGNEDYKNAEYKVKQKIILEKNEYKSEKDFYLNKFFEEKEIFDVATVDERYKQLKREFKNIFIDSTNAEFTLSRFEEIIGVREMDNRE